MPKILVIDDNEDTLNSFSTLLSGWIPDSHVILAQSGEEGLTRAEDEFPDTILLDINMQGMDGFSVCKRLKADERLRHIPIVMITGLGTDTQTKINALNLGADAFMAKPPEASELVAQVKAMLRIKESEDLLRDEKVLLEKLLDERTKSLKEKERYMRTIMDTVQTGLIVNDSSTHEIVDANPYALEMIGCEKEHLIGRDLNEYISHLSAVNDNGQHSAIPNSGDDCLLRTTYNGRLQVRLSQAPAKIKGRQCSVKSFLDITDMKHLLEEQAVNINLAKEILKLINGHPPRNIDLEEGLGLFVDAVSASCHAAGGDHYFVKHLPDNGGRGAGKTIISLKDQSGHEVNCVLRSIITDLIHNAILYGGEPLTLEESTDLLNDEICDTSLFDGDDFLTAVNVAIDNDTLMMRYVSCGHPPFLLIRGGEILSFPERGGPGENLPLASIDGVRYTAEELQLQEGDKLIFYTDGLTDMPYEILKRKITLEELKRIVGDLIKRDGRRRVSDIVKHLIDHISLLSNREIIPFVKNTSSDDMTIFGLEVENTRAYNEEIFKPRNRKDLDNLVYHLMDRIPVEWREKGFEINENHVRCVLEESVQNAWNHGNGRDGQKQIRVRWRCGNDCHLEVLDQGSGFEFHRIEDPTTLKNRLKESGRGIFMIRLFADELRWKKGGSHIVSSFRSKIFDQKKGPDRGTDFLMPLWGKRH